MAIQLSGSLAMSGSIIATGEIIAQMLNVQQVTSSVIYSSGSNIFGNSLSNTQQFTGSVLVTGSLTVSGPISGTGPTQGTIVYGSTVVCSPSILSSGTICSTSNTCFGGNTIIAGCLGIGTNTPSDKLEVNGAILSTANTILTTTKGAIFDFNDGQDAGRMLAYKSTGANLLFYTNASGGSLTERLRITSTGVSCFSNTVCVPNLQSSGPVLAGGAVNIDSSLAVQVSSEGSGTQKWFGANKNGAYGLIMGYSETVGLAGVGAYIRQVTSDPLHFVVNNTTTALSISSTGVSCFSTTVCAPMILASGCVLIGDTAIPDSAKLVIRGGNNSLRLWSDVATDQPGMFVVTCNGSGNSNLYAKVYGASIVATVFGQAIACKAILATEGACNTGLLFGTLNNAPIYIGTNNQNRILLDANGVACFACSVNAVGLFSTTSASGNLASKIRNGVTSASGTTGYGLAIESEASAASSYALTVRNLAETTTYFHILTETGRVGNVGINTTTPNYKLEVNGTSCFAGNVAIGGTYCAFALNVHGVTYQIGGSVWVQNGYGYVNAGAVSTGLFPLSDCSIQLRIANSAALTIDPTQNVGLGTTTPKTRVFSLGLDGGQVGAGGCGCSAYSGGGKAALTSYFGDQFGNGAPYGTSAGAIAPYPVWYGGGAGGYFKGGGPGGGPGGGGAGIVAIGGDGSSYISGGSPYADGGAGIYARGGFNVVDCVRTWAGYFEGSIYACVVGIKTTSLSTEANLFLGAQGPIEGGQLVLQKGTSCSCATHIDNYQDTFRIMSGTDTGSTTVNMAINHKTGNACFSNTVCAPNFFTTAGGTVSACRFYTATLDVAVNNGVFTDIFCSYGSGGVWLVSFTLNGNPGQIGYAIVGNAFGTAITLLAGATGSQTCITTSGLKLQVCQTSGANLTARVSSILLTNIIA